MRSEGKNEGSGGEGREGRGGRGAVAVPDPSVPGCAWAKFWSIVLIASHGNSVVT